MATAAPSKPKRETLQEFTSNRGVALKVDRENHRIRGVKILGESSRNGRRYSQGAMAAAVSLYEGAKVNIDHPRKGEDSRSYRDRIAVLEGVSHRPGDGLYGDLNYNPKHVLAEQFLFDAENSPQNVGLSHNARGRTAKHGSETVVEEIQSVQSVDIVADPATTNGLYESETTEPDTQLSESEQLQMELKGLTLAQLQEARPDLLTAHANALAEGEAAKAEKAKLAEALKELDALKAAAALQEHKANVAKAIADAKLPAVVVTESFKTLCENTTDAKQLAALIEERKELATGVKSAGGTKPKSVAADSAFLEAQPTFDPKAYAASLSR